MGREEGCIGKYTPEEDSSGGDFPDNDERMNMIGNNIVDRQGLVIEKDQEINVALEIERAFGI